MVELLRHCYGITFNSACLLVCFSDCFIKKPRRTKNEPISCVDGYMRVEELPSGKGIADVDCVPKNMTADPGP